MPASPSPSRRPASLVSLALCAGLAACASSVPLDRPPPRRAPVVDVAPPPAAAPAPAAPPAPAAAPVQTFPIGDAPAGAAPAASAPEPAASAVVGDATPASPPYGEAVAARFPDPTLRYDTPGLREGHAGYTTQAELDTWLRGLADAPRAAGAVRLLDLGTSQGGTPLQGLRFSRAPVGEARGARPAVLLIGGQHGDEPASCEALMVVARELAEGRLAPLLDKLDVIVVPRANPDGAQAGRRSSAGGVDVNRDHLLLQTPEAQALARLMREYAPSLVVDAHEYSPLGPWREKFGAVPRADALLQYAMTPNVQPFVTRAAEEWFRRPLLDALTREGLTSEWYFTTSDDVADRSVSMGGPAPDTARNVAGLRNAVGFLLETRGIGLGRLHLQRRVHTQVTALSSLLASAAARAPDLVRLRGYVDAAVAAAACQGEAVVAAQPTHSEHSLLMLDPASGADKRVTVDWNSALTLQSSVVRPRPCGYWLAADEGDAVRRLRDLGLQVQQVTANTSVQGDAYRPGTAPMELVDALIDMPAGSFYVPLTQPLANLAIAALEPDAPAGYLAHGAIPAPDRIARVRLPPAASLAPLQ